MPSCPLSPLSKLGTPNLGQVCMCVCDRSPESPGALSSTSLALQPRPSASALCCWVILDPLLLVVPLCVPSVDAPNTQGQCSLGLLVDSWVGLGEGNF